MEKIEYGRNVLHIRGSLYMKIKKINFQRIIDSSSSERYQIKALIKGKGLIAKSISGLGKIRMPEFAEVSHLFLVREGYIEYKRIVLHKRKFL